MERSNSTRVVTIKMAAAQAWRDEWIEIEEGITGSWPTYTLEVSVDGEKVGSITGWHYVGWWDRFDGNGDEWERRDSDEQSSGLPTFDPETRTIRAGDNLVDGDLVLPAGAYDADAIETAIETAAGQAKHGDAPTDDEGYSQHTGAVEECDPQADYDDCDML